MRFLKHCFNFVRDSACLDVNGQFIRNIGLHQQVLCDVSWINQILDWLVCFTVLLLFAVPNHKARQSLPSDADDVIGRLLDVELRISDDVDPPRPSDGPSAASDANSSTPSLQTISERRLRSEMRAARKLELVGLYGWFTSTSNHSYSSSDTIKGVPDLM